MEGYSVKILEASKELTAKQKVQLKDTTDAIKLDDVTKSGAIILDPDFYAVLQIHNENSDNKDYYNYLVVCKDGEKYVTGSESFWSSFEDIMSDMFGSEEEFHIKVYKLPSKKYNGKEFITCSIV